MIKNRSKSSRWSRRRSVSSKTSRKTFKPNCKPASLLINHKAARSIISLFKTYLETSILRKTQTKVLTLKQYEIEMMFLSYFVYKFLSQALSLFSFLVGRGNSCSIRSFWETVTPLRSFHCFASLSSAITWASKWVFWLRFQRFWVFVLGVILMYEGFQPLLRWTVSSSWICFDCPASTILLIFLICRHSNRSSWEAGLVFWTTSFVPWTCELENCSSLWSLKDVPSYPFPNDLTNQYLALNNNGKVHDTTLYRHFCSQGKVTSFLE